MIRAAVVAPILAFRAGLQAMLRTVTPADQTEHTPEVVFEAASLDEFATSGIHCDVLLVTADALSGSALRQAVLPFEGQLAVLLLTDNPQAGKILSGLPLRAWGILPMDVSMEELQVTVRALHEGLVVGNPALLEPVLARFLTADEGEAYAVVETLTDREIQVLQLLARGLANKQIAISLGISEHTVKFHVSSIYGKLGVTNRTEAVRAGLQQGLILL